MPKIRRITARDVALAGSLDDLIRKLVDSVRDGNMETKEKSSVQLRSLTIQNPENPVRIAEAGAIKPLVALVLKGSSQAQTHACVTLSNIAHQRRNYQEAIAAGGGVVALTHVLRVVDSALQEQAAAAIASIS